MVKSLSPSAITLFTSIGIIVLPFSIILFFCFS